MIYTCILHPKGNERDQLLKALFNLYKKPSYAQRQVLLHACLCFAKQSGPVRVHAELLPQCWENLNHKLDERRCFVAEACGILAPHLSVNLGCLVKLREESSPDLLERHPREFDLLHVATNAGR